MNEHIVTEVIFIRYTRLMRRIHAGRDALLARIDDDGLLRLTMDDMRPGTSFEGAGCCDLRFSVVPVYRASKIILEHEGQERVLKDRRPPMSQIFTLPSRAIA